MWNVMRIGDRGSVDVLISTDSFPAAASFMSQDVKRIAGISTIGQLINDPEIVQYRSYQIPTDARQMHMTWLLCASPKTAPVPQPETIEMVEFVWTFDHTFNVNAEEGDKLRDAFFKAFSRTAPNGYTVVRCRPDQFARFLIIRNNLGTRNGFKNLQPQLINVAKTTYDVSGG